MSEEIFDVNIENIPEIKLLPPGEKLLRIVSATVKKSEKEDARPYLWIRMEDPTDPLIADFYVGLFSPRPDSDPKSAAVVRQRYKDFLDAFSLVIPPDGVSNESLKSWVGATGMVAFKHETNQQTGALQHKVTGFLVAK